MGLVSTLYRVGSLEEKNLILKELKKNLILEELKKNLILEELKKKSYPRRTKK